MIFRFQRGVVKVTFFPGFISKLKKRFFFSSRKKNIKLNNQNIPQGYFTDIVFPFE
jgi:hypothetical protein